MNNFAFLRNVQRGPESLAAVATFEANDRLVRDHQLGGVPLLPAAVMLELCAEAAGALIGDIPGLLITDFAVTTGLRFYDSAAAQVRVLAERIGDSVKCSLRGEYHDRRTGEHDADREYARGIFGVEDANIHSRSQLLSGRNDPISLIQPDAPHDPQLAGTVQHGPAWCALTTLLQCDETSAWFEIDCSQLPEAVIQRMRNEVVSTPVIDALLQACDVHCARTLGTAQLPAGWSRLQVVAASLRTTAPLRLRVLRVQERADRFLYEAEVFSLEGTCVLRADGIELWKRKRSRVG